MRIPDTFRNNNAVRVKPSDRECAHLSGPIIQLERYTSGAFSTYYNGAQKHVRNEQTFPEYLLPRALEKIWETPSLENEEQGGWRTTLGEKRGSVYPTYKARTSAASVRALARACMYTYLGASHGRGRAFACERAQGLNFNYFLFGRYNISMLGAEPGRPGSPLAAISVK